MKLSWWHNFVSLWHATKLQIPCVFCQWCEQPPHTSDHQSGKLSCRGIFLSTLEELDHYYGCTLPALRPSLPYSDTEGVGGAIWILSPILKSYARHCFPLYPYYRLWDTSVIICNVIEIVHRGNIKLAVNWRFVNYQWGSVLKWVATKMSVGRDIFPDVETSLYSFQSLSTETDEQIKITGLKSIVQANSYVFRKINREERGTVVGRSGSVLKRRSWVVGPYKFVDNCNK